MKTTTNTKLSTKQVADIIARAQKAAAKSGKMGSVSRALDQATKGLTSEQAMQVGMAYIEMRRAG